MTLNHQTLQAQFADSDFPARIKFVMPPFPNLISDSLLISETIQLLQSFGGRASAVKVVDYVMKINAPAPDLAKLLVSDLAAIDPRLFLNDDTLELIETDFERRNFADTNFVVFDLETTGAKTPPCRITEIGAYRVRNGKITEEFQTLVNPEIPIPTFITQLTGISNRMVKNAPVFGEVAADFLDFIGDSVLVAHNAHFDMRFLNHEIGRIHKDYRVGNPSLCTVRLSRRLLPHVENHRLKTLADYYSVALVNHHRASDDAYATAHIFINLLEQLNLRGVRNLATAKKFKF
ncbi:MAG: 3'-5' exonuclease [Pyrinomonadaceae bacterium]